MRPLALGLVVLLGIGFLPELGNCREAAAADKVVSPELAKRANTVLKDAAQSAEFWPGMHACEALTQTGERSFVRALLAGKLDKETDRQRQCGLAREQVRAGDRTHVTKLLEILADTKSNGRTHAAESLFKVAEIGDGRLVRAAFAEKDVSLMLMSAAALARCGNRAALEPVRQLLQQSDSQNRMLAAWVLGQVGDASDLPALRKAAGLETAVVARSFIFNALARLQDAAAVEEVGKNLSHAETEVRTYALDALAGLRLARFLPEYQKLLEDKNLDTRVRAAQAILLLDRPADVVLSDIAVTVYEANADHPRYSEGSVIPLANGHLLFAITEFNKQGADASPAQVTARISANGGRAWGKPFILQENVGKQNVMCVSLTRLDSPAISGPIGMFYLVQNSASDAHMELRISTDEGKTFGDRIKVTNPDGFWFANNDRVLLLSSGRLLMPVAGTPDQHKKDHWTSRVYFSDDDGKTWKAGKEDVDVAMRGAMEPDVVELQDGRVLMMIRTQLGQIYTALSPDGGDTWSDAKPWGVRSPESPATIRRIPATGDLLLIWNDNVEPGKDHMGKRRPLTAAISQDDGKTWKFHRNLETRQDQSYAYTSLVFDRDRVLLSYYVGDDSTGRISTKFRSLPLTWFYEQVKKDH